MDVLFVVQSYDVVYYFCIVCQFECSAYDSAVCVTIRGTLLLAGIICQIGSKLPVIQYYQVIGPICPPSKCLI